MGGPFLFRRKYMQKNGIRTIEQLISIPRAAKRLDVSERTVKRYIRLAEVPVYIVGKRQRIAEADLEKLVMKVDSLDNLIHHEF
jgi:excisionase family DNA binding protein